ncbi:E3 ubiquitin-protein ligase TRIM7 isoform 2-T3 [Hipposideros larvatus]
MAAVGPRTGPGAGAEALALAAELQGEATCSICLELFRDPVSVECGHSFCRACIARCWQRPGAGAAAAPRAPLCPLPCPQCREPARPSQLRPNRQLAAVAALLRRFSLPAVAREERESPEAVAVGCAQHGEPLKLYCQDDGRAICVVCDRAREHRAHAVLPLEEAVQEAKELLESRLKVLKKDLEDYEMFRSTEEKESKELLKQMAAERENVGAEFQALRAFLVEQEGRLLGRLEELSREVTQKQNENLAQLGGEITQLSKLSSQIKETACKPDLDFLQREHWVPTEGSSDNSLTRGAFAELWAESKDHTDETSSCQPQWEALGTRSHAGGGTWYTFLLLIPLDAGQGPLLFSQRCMEVTQC